MIQIDMEKPNHCLRCPMRNVDDGCVLIQENDPSWDWEEQYANCPLQEVEPERKKGKWIITSEFDDCCYAKCNQCNVTQIFYYGKPLTNYCPNCGSYNGGEQE